jgi:hypothetical protein
MKRMGRQLALIVALSLPALSAGAGTIYATASASVVTQEFNNLSAVRGSYSDVNQATGALYTGTSNQTLVVDDTIFFGTLGGQTRSRASSLSITTTFNLGASEPPVYFSVLYAPEPRAALLIGAVALLLGLRRRTR